MTVHIGNLIWQVLKRKRISVKDFADMACSDRTNMYRILHRESIDLSVLNKYSHLLDYDFFKDLSDNYQSERTDS